MHVLDARATSRSFSSTTSHSTSPTNLPALTTRDFARSYALHTGRTTPILSSIVARLSSSASVLRYAKPLRVLEVGGAPGVWVDDKLGIGNLLLENERIDRRDHNVVAAIDDRDRMGDRGQRLVPVSGRKDAQVRERFGLGVHRCFARGRICLTARARGVEEVQEVQGAGDRMGRCLRHIRSNPNQRFPVRILLNRFLHSSEVP